MAALVTLRHATRGDATMLFRYVASSEVTRYLTWRPYTDRASVDEYVERICTKTAFPDETLVIDVAGVPAGTVHIIARPERRTQFGFGLLPEYWGQGIGTAVAEATIAYIAASTWRSETDVLLGGVHVENIAAQRILAHCGFTLSQENIEPNRHLYACYGFAS